MPGARFRRSVTDDRGVTPVIGIVLLTVIVVILAGIVGHYVFGLDLIENQNPGPQVAFDAEFDEGATTLTIRHDGGDKIENPQSRLSVDVSDNSLNYNPDSDPDDRSIPSDVMTTDDEIELQDIGSDAEVRVIWTNPTTSDSIVVFGWHTDE